MSYKITEVTEYRCTRCGEDHRAETDVTSERGSERPWPALPEGWAVVEGSALRGMFVSKQEAHLCRPCDESFREWFRKGQISVAPAPSPVPPDAPEVPAERCLTAYPNDVLALIADRDAQKARATAAEREKSAAVGLLQGTALALKQEIATRVTAEAEAARLRDALQFYTHEASWREYEDDAWSSVEDGNFGSILGNDKGATARRALAGKGSA